MVILSLDLEIDPDVAAESGATAERRLASLRDAMEPGAHQKAKAIEMRYRGLYPPDSSARRATPDEIRSELADAWATLAQTSALEAKLGSSRLAGLRALDELRLRRALRAYGALLEEEQPVMTKLQHDDGLPSS
jgi:hypothetical protein